MDSKHNLNALLIGTGEFSFSEDATTVAEARAKGFIDLGNIKAFAPKVETQKQVHKGSYRGRLIKDKTLVTQQDITYTLTAEEWKKTNLAILFGASLGSGFTQTIQTAANGDALDFTTINSDSTKWYDITKTSARIMRLTALTVATKVEGTDFEVDYLLGKIRFLTVQTTSLIPVITAPAITSSDTNFMPSIVPHGKMIRSGVGRLTCYDQSTKNIVFDHRDFLCEVTCDNTGNIDGDKWSELTLTVAVIGTLPGEIFIGGVRTDVTA